MAPTNDIDLRRLPVWAQYAISLAVIAVVSAAAWIVGRNRPVPHWIVAYLIPFLGWAYIVLFVYAMAFLAVTRWRKK